MYNMYRYNMNVYECISCKRKKENNTIQVAGAACPGTASHGPWNRCVRFTVGPWESRAGGVKITSCGLTRINYSEWRCQWI